MCSYCTVVLEVQISGLSYSLVEDMISLLQHAFLSLVLNFRLLQVKSSVDYWSQTLVQSSDLHHMFQRIGKIFKPSTSHL